MHDTIVNMVWGWILGIIISIFPRGDLLGFVQILLVLYAILSVEA
jgi:hypothetical protein